MGAMMVPPPGTGQYCYRIHGQVYHQIGPLYPAQDKPPKCGKKYEYILKGHQATNIRKSQHHKFNHETLDSIQTVKEEVTVGPYAASCLSWDENLAELAHAWAEACHYAHGQPDNVPRPEGMEGHIGQNLHIHWGGGPDLFDATQGWYDEVKGYTYQAGSGGDCSIYACGHYTQVVWSTTNRIGCARSLCPHLTTNGRPYQDAWYIVCNYYPPGNQMGVQPYAIGAPCSECASGSGQCYEGQCRPCTEHREECECALESCENCGTVDPSSCTCDCPDGFYGMKCEVPCVDEADCQPWKEQYCADSRFRIRDECPALCGTCNKANGNDVCDPGSVPGPAPGVCGKKFTAAVYINSVLHLFKADKVWRVRSDGALLSPIEGDIASDLFSQLPDKPTAAYQLGNGDVIFLRGWKMFTYRGSKQIERSTLPDGVPDEPTGAIHIPYDDTTYVFKGSKVYRLNGGTLDDSYPKPIAEVFPGVPPEISVAFSDDSGNIYFVRPNRKVYKISRRGSSVDDGYPKHFTQTFIQACAE